MFVRSTSCCDGSVRDRLGPCAPPPTSARAEEDEGALAGATALSDCTPPFPPPPAVSPSPTRRRPSLGMPSRPSTEFCPVASMGADPLAAARAARPPPTGAAAAAALARESDER